MPEGPWVGFTKRALKAARPVKDIQECGECGRTYYYARTGRRVAIKAFVRSWCGVSGCRLCDGIGHRVGL